MKTKVSLKLSSIHKSFLQLYIFRILYFFLSFSQLRFSGEDEHFLHHNDHFYKIVSNYLEYCIIPIAYLCKPY